MEWASFFALKDFMESDSDISDILTKLSGTREEEILQAMKELYAQIAQKQSIWYEKSGFTCPRGCGECCRNFEPDLLECEADYMAAWLLENKADVAEKVSDGEFPFPENKGCPFWNENDDHHCSIYGGRAFVCRFFGAYGAKSKTGELIFKPCKFYPAEILSSHKPPLSHRQYREGEVREIFGILPPISTDTMEKAISINPDNIETKMLREILPKSIQRIKWICSMASGN